MGVHWQLWMLHHNGWSVVPSTTRSGDLAWLRFRLRNSHLYVPLHSRNKVKTVVIQLHVLLEGESDPLDRPAIISVSAVYGSQHRARLPVGVHRENTVVIQIVGHIRSIRLDVS